MEISIFDVLGPIMIGPSSSHTAGAAKLAYTARKIIGIPFHKVISACMVPLPKPIAGMEPTRRWLQARWA